MINMTTTPTTPQPQLAGSYLGFMQDPNFQAISAIEDPNMRSFAMWGYLSDRSRKSDMEGFPEIISKIRDQQFEDYQRFRPYAFGDLMARNLVETVTKIPGQIAAARQMYGPEAATAFGKQTQGFTSPAVPRYF